MDGQDRGADLRELHTQDRPADQLPPGDQGEQERVEQSRARRCCRLLAFPFLRRRVSSMTVIGNSDLDVFPLGLGGNTFGWTSDKETSFAVLDAYVAGGGNFIDTADSYSAWVPGNAGGESETIIGEWTAARRNRDSVIIATKVSRHPQFRGLAPRQHRGRGGRLACPAADGLHRPLLRALRRAGRAGRGSSGGVPLAARGGQDPARRALEHHRAPAPRVVRRRPSRGVGAAGGAPAALQPGGASRLRDHVRAGRRGVRARRAAVLRARERLPRREVPERRRSRGRGQAAGRHQVPDQPDRSGGARGARLGRPRTRGVAPATVALAWLRSRPKVVAPLASARTVDQLPALLASATLDLTSDEIEALDKASAA